VVVADALLRVAVEDDADVVDAVGNDHAWLAIGDDATPNLGRYVVVAANVVAVVVAHGFLHACAALRAGGGMVAIWSRIRYVVRPLFGMDALGGRYGKKLVSSEG